MAAMRRFVSLPVAVVRGAEEGCGGLAAVVHVFGRGCGLVWGLDLDWGWGRGWCGAATVTGQWRLAVGDMVVDDGGQRMWLEPVTRDSGRSQWSEATTVVTIARIR
ncbi:unnamed protein product [Cuscuta europaea]|uniref:Uncharacterized protein n=1 Tax=Cuscuta europaea TaxID=41803 RepID=A0A9P1E1P6_CUSEU|nr:unnamed protein product [Cuscuta europaea]